MRKACTISVLVAISLALAVLSCAGAFAQDEPPIRISLTAAETSFGPTDPIKLQIRVYNDPNDATTDVITRKKFFGQNFYTLITFTDPDGLPVRNIFKDETDDPGPPDSFSGRPAAEVEIIPALPDGERIIVLDDAREFYRLEKYGWYTGQVLVPMETFSYYVADERGVLYSFLDDTGRKGYNPVASNKVRFEILSPEPLEIGAIHVKVAHLKIGQETRPRTTKTPLENVAVRLIPQAEIPEDYHPINWKTYDQIWAWTNGPGARFTVTRNTDNQGLAKFDSIGRDDYLVLAYYSQSQDFKHMGSPIPADDPDWATPPIVKNLMVMEKDKGKKVPGKTTKLKGSELLITEPEFVLWDGEQEQYPFVFESIGEWEVSTSIAPPEGFVADYEALDAQVVNELQAVQFTITDVGTKYKQTTVNYVVKHKGKKEKMESKIGIKLSKRLTKKKGVGIYGDTEAPGLFKGGKKLKDKDKDKDKDKGKGKGRDKD